MPIADPAGRLKWLAKDRCLVTFDKMKDVDSKAAALRDVENQWIEQM